MGHEYVLEMIGITKEFPGVKALDNVSFKVRKGEIHALCGENGAGKSTLMKVLSGVYPYGTYNGSIVINNVEQKYRKIRDAEEAGISIIYQELSLAKNLSVAENVFMGNEPLKNGLIDWTEMYLKTGKLLDKVGLALGTETLVGKLGIGQQQLVEIAKALRSRCEILVLDEPTSALTNSEVETLMDLLMKLKKEGVTCIYISHRLDEVFRIADRVTVLRDGQTVGTENVEAMTEESIIKLMVGRSMTERYPRKQHVKGDFIFEVKGYSFTTEADDKEIVHDISFKLYKGEILGIAGLMGAGRTELVNSIFGAVKGTSKGELLLEGKEIKIKTPKDAIKYGLGLITEDRKNYGVIKTGNIRENMSIASLDRIPGTVAMHSADEWVICNSFIRSLKIKLSTMENKITSLSGGNQQKVILGRWLMTEPKVLFLDEPTRGIDVGAKFEIYNIINELVENGVGIIMISSELPEILGMCDRILVMHDGKITGEVPYEDATQEKIMNYAIGSM
jgi:ABC-type sugar transport system ATPase subunit